MLAGAYEKAIRPPAVREASVFAYRFVVTRGNGDGRHNRDVHPTAAPKGFTLHLFVQAA